MHPDWFFTSCDTKLTEHLSSQLGIHPITAKILINRGVKTVEEGKIFLSPQLTGLIDPYSLPDMERAVERILTAIENGERITVYGDYDTDGITATTLLIRFFREIGVLADYYIPHRITEGYGLAKNAIDKIKERGTSLIITTDCGINACEEIDYANSLKIDTIVTDHHETATRIPNAAAIVNPKRDRHFGSRRLQPAQITHPKGCGYHLGDSPEGEYRNDHGLDELAGVGVAFYLICALRTALRKRGFFTSSEPNLKTLLDFVALGTVADVVPLTRINRIIVKHGIEQLKKTNNYGIKALANVAATDLSTIDTYGIAFRLAPRINAAGRIADQYLGIELLLATSPGEAERIANLLDHINSERQGMEKKILAEAEKILKGRATETSSIVLWSDRWHPGVIGIVANRLSDKHKKPCVLIGIDKEMGKGSARGVGNFDVLAGISHCKEYLENFGGHKNAAGVTIKTENLKKFAEGFEAYTAEVLTPEDRSPPLTLDAEIALDDIDHKLLTEFELLSPFGKGNPPPLIATKPAFARNARVVGNNHLKLTITDRDTNIDAIGFTLGETKIEPETKYHFAGTPQLNYWNGNTIPQLKLKAIFVSDTTV